MTRLLFFNSDEHEILSVSAPYLSDRNVNYRPLTLPLSHSIMWLAVLFLLKLELYLNANVIYLFILLSLVQQFNSLSSECFVTARCRA